MGTFQVRNKQLEWELQSPLKSSAFFPPILVQTLPWSLTFLFEYFFLFSMEGKNVSPGGILTGLKQQLKCLTLAFFRPLKSQRQAKSIERFCCLRFSGPTLALGRPWWQYKFKRLRLYWKFPNTWTARRELSRVSSANTSM